MKDTLQLFNYKVLTDSATGNEFYAIDRQELTCAVTVPSLKSANNGFTKGYLIGFGNGVLWTFAAAIIINFIIRFKNNKNSRNKN